MCPSMFTQFFSFFFFRKNVWKSFMNNIFSFFYSSRLLTFPPKIIFWEDSTRRVVQLFSTFLRLVSCQSKLDLTFQFEYLFILITEKKQKNRNYYMNDKNNQRFQHRTFKFLILYHKKQRIHQSIRVHNTVLCWFIIR